MHYIKIILTTLVLTLIFPCLSTAAGYKEWQVKPDCIFAMPYLGHILSKTEKGILMDVLREVYEPEKINIKHEAVPFVRALEGTIAGKYHLTLGISPRKKLITAKIPIGLYDLSACYLKDKAEWKGVESLTGQEVVYLYGFDLQSYLPVKVRKQIVYDLSSAFDMLDRGHVKYILDDNWLLKDAMIESQYPPYLFDIKEIKRFKVWPLFADTPDGRKFQAMYDRRMKELLESGKLAKIYKRHGLSDKYIARLFDLK